MHFLRLTMALGLMLPAMGIAQTVFLDTFGSQSYGNNDGTGFFTGTWIEINDDALADSGKISIDGDRLRFQDLDPLEEQISRMADLSNYERATLIFDWETVGLDGTNDANTESLSIEASLDGNTFTNIGTLLGSEKGVFSADLSDYISATTTLRFYNTGPQGSGKWEPGEMVYIDNFMIIEEGDQDGDGVVDSVDLDDDNDGLTDAQEFCTQTDTFSLVSMNVGERSVIVNHSGTGYLQLDFSTLDNSFQLLINGTPIHPSVLEFQNGDRQNGEAYFRFSSDNSFISTHWIANNNGLPRVRLIVDQTGRAHLYGTKSQNSDALEPIQEESGTPFNVIPWVPGATNTFTIINQNGDGIEGFSGSLSTSLVCDTDDDGIADHLDLDSDNDGLYDLDESGPFGQVGTMDADRDGTIDGLPSDFGDNGFINALEDNDFPFALSSHSPTDTSGDGSNDAKSLDSDGDGCSDVIEAGFTDTNGDGVLDPIPATIDTNGTISNALDGYSQAEDNNTNDIPDFQEAGTVPNIVVHPTTSITSCPGCTLQLSANITGNVFQWQRLSNGDWIDVLDSDRFSGTQSPTLTIIPTTMENNAQFRLSSSFVDYKCGFTYSNPALVSIRASTVVSNRRITYRVNTN